MVICTLRGRSNTSDRVVGGLGVFGTGVAISSNRDSLWIFSIFVRDCVSRVVMTRLELDINH